MSVEQLALAWDEPGVAMVKTRAVDFSADELYRYKLSITWDDSLWRIMFLMLNPSTADAVKNDPTVKRCERRAESLGYGCLMVGNLFAFRSTDPDALQTARDPVGPRNDAALLEMSREADTIVCAWGGQAGRLGAERAAYVKSLLRGRELHYLKMSNGVPWHPLYIGYDEPLKIWK